MRPRSAVESWVSSSAQMPQISSHIDLRPITQGLTIIPRAKSASRPSTGGLSRRNTLKSDSASSVQSVSDENLSSVDIENLLLERVKDRKDDLKAAFEAFDQEGNKTVTKGEFRRIIEGFLIPLTDSQFEGLLTQFDLKENGTISYSEFLRRYCKVSSAVGRIPSKGGSYRNLSLGELQCQLKDKVGGNLKNITRAFRLFDYNNDGQIQQHELRKVLEGYCFPMTQLEFHRLWSHYSVNNADTISYKKFLEKLGVDCENCRKIAPDSIQLALNWDAASRTITRAKSKTSLRGFSGTFRKNLDEVQIRFLSKMKKNYSLVEKALQAFDISDSGFVSLEDLRSVLSHFLFPIDDDVFRELLNRLGVSSREPVKRKIFLGLFKDDITVRKDSPDSCSIKTILSKLRQHVLNHPLLDFDNTTGFVSRDELCRALENMNFYLTDEQFAALADFLDADHTDAINYQQLTDFLHLQNPNVQTLTPNKKTEARLNIATTAQNAVEEILKERLCENYDILIKSITNTTQNQSDTISPEDFRRLIQQHGLPLSERHFSKLCEPFLEGGNVNYKLFLKSLGVLEKTESGLCVIEREEKAHEASILNIKAQAIKDVVLRKLKDRLQRRGTSLQDYLMSTRRSMTSVLTLRDFSKILDDCGVFLEGPQFQTLIETLGFNLGPVSVAEFMDKYEEVTIPEKDEDSQTKNIKLSTLLTAEDCLGQFKKRIKEYHGDPLTAFRLMDKNRDGLVNRIDFRALFDSLMFVTQEREYQRFLDLLGLTPGATLNYTDFYNKVHSSGKMKSHLHDDTLGDGCLVNACDQVHEYLAVITHKRPSEISMAFCQLGNDCKSIMTKNGLKQLLFKYNMPISPNEFETLWGRYDEEGKGFVTQTEFLRKLKVTSDQESQSDILLEQPTDGAISTTPDLEVMLQNLRKWIGRDFESVSGILVVLDKNKDGHVTVADMLSLLHRHGFQLTETQFTHLLSLFGFDTCLKELPYLDFLKHLAGSPVSSAVDPPQAPPVGSPKPVEDVEELSPGRAMQRVKELATASSDTLFKAFSAFDKTGDGMISQAEFRQVLDHFCMHLSDVQFKTLLSELSVNEGEETMVHWKKFLQVFNLHNQETADEWLKKICKMRFPNQIRPLAIGDILRRVQEVVSARVYTITKELVDLDYANINTISKTDFKTICDRHFMRLTNDQFQNLWKLLPVNDFGNLKYREFLKKFSGGQKGLEKVAKSLPGSARSTLEERPASLRRPKTAPCAFRRSMSSVSERVQRPSTASRRSTPLLNCEDVEMKLRPKIQDFWRHIQRRCRQADPERTGEIHVDAFLEILQGLHIELSPLEFEQLTVKYDMKNSGRVSYPDFLRHFVLTFSPDVNASSIRPRLQLPKTALSPGPLSPQCIEAMLRISRPVQLFWRQMRQRFISFDKERTGKISLQDFRKVLRQFSVNLSEEEFFHFTSFFDKNLSGSISYNDFLRIFLK